MTRSRAVITALCVVSVLALGACSGSDPQPKFADPTPSQPTSPSTTAVSGPVEPTMPPAARGTDAAAAEAFVKFYWEMVNYAQATGDLAGLRDLGSPTCQACRTVLDYLGGIYTHGGSVSGGSTTVSRVSASAASGGPTRAYSVEATIANTRQVVHDPRKAKDQVFPAAEIDAHFIAEHASGGWRVAFWETRS